MSTNQPEPTPHDGPPPAPPTPPTAPPPAQYGAPVVGSPLNQSEERMWAMFGHLGGILIGFVAPLITWLLFRERSAFVNDQGKEALNFQITIAIALAVSWVLTTVLVGFLGVVVFSVANLVLCIMAGIAANNGTAYRYPFTLRLVK